MKTSYFARVHLIKSPVSIARFSPSWYHGPKFKLLAPSWELVRSYKNKEINKEEYIGSYNELLSELNPKKIYNEIVSKYGENATLLCYEKPSDFCHRHLVASWLEKELGVNVPEFSPSKALIFKLPHSER